MHGEKFFEVNRETYRNPDVAIDSVSPFWSLNEPIDVNGDPLELLIREEEGDEIAAQLLNRERKRVMNYLTKLQALMDDNKLSREGFILALRSLTNWCNGNLMTISQMRLANLAKRGDPDLGASPADEPAGEPSDEHTQNERAAETGHEQRQTLTQRGDCFASVRQACYEAAEELRLTGYDRPRNMAEYLDGRATGLRKAVPSKEDIAIEQRNSLGISEDEAREFLIASNKAQAAKIEQSKEDVVAEDGTYENDIDMEEALSLLGAVAQHRLRIKILSDVIRETKRLQEIRKEYPTFEDLRTKRHLLLWDVITFDQELREFDKAHKAGIDKELFNTNRVLADLPREFQMTLDLVKRQVRENQLAAAAQASAAASSAAA